jgi:toxin FitB
VTLLVDTNVVSELRKGRRTNVNVRAWFESVDDNELYLSVLVVGELRQGVERLRQRDASAAARLDRWLVDLVESYGERILTIDAAVAERWGRLNVPDPIPAVDGLLAATALVHSLTLVTRNVRDVQRTGVRIIDPFSG